MRSGDHRVDYLNPTRHAGPAHELRCHIADDIAPTVTSGQQQIFSEWPFTEFPVHNRGVPLGCDTQGRFLCQEEIVPLPFKVFDRPDFDARTVWPKSPLVYLLKPGRDYIDSRESGR